MQQTLNRGVEPQSSKAVIQPGFLTYYVNNSLTWVHTCLSENSFLLGRPGKLAVLRPSLKDLAAFMAETQWEHPWRRTHVSGSPLSSCY